MIDNRKRAFTLVELLVVIAIIGLLASISIIALNSARAKARDVKRIADAKQITTALELFFNDAGHYPDSNDWNTGSLSYSGTVYLANIPVAPNPPDGTCDSSTNTFTYSQDDAGASYTLSLCTGGVVASLSAGNICATPAGINDNCSGPGSWACGDSVSYGGETYPTVLIDTQCWMAKPLNIGDFISSGNSANGHNGISGDNDDCIDSNPGNNWWSC